MSALEEIKQLCIDALKIKEEDDWGEYHCGLMDGKQALASEILTRLGAI